MCELEAINLMEFEYVHVRSPSGEKVQRFKRHAVAVGQEASKFSKTCRANPGLYEMAIVLSLPN